METAAQFAVQIHISNTVKLNKFLPCKNEDTIRDFIANITENRAELKNLPVQKIRAKDITCSFDMPMRVLLQRNLSVNMTQDIRKKQQIPRMVLPI